jgi:hypothetical protein
MRMYQLLLALTLYFSAAMAGEAPIQPQLLPMEQLLKTLDQAQEWMLVPLADYRALMKASAVKEPLDPGLRGARIATAHITGTLGGDRVLALQGSLVVNSHGPGPHRCQLFARRPSRIGEVMCDGQPAVVLNAGDGMDVLVPGDGVHQVTASWGIDLVGKDRDRKGDLPMPLAGAVTLTIDAATAGSFSGDALVADPAAPGRWRLVRGASAQVDVVWEPGRIGTDTSAVFGVEQIVQAEVLNGPSSFRWVARIIARRGAVPEQLEVVLPPGWRLTESASAGVLSLSELADGHVRLRLAPGTTEISCDGLRDFSAAVALPQIIGAAYQGGVVNLVGPSGFDVSAPSEWRRLEDGLSKTQPGRHYAVPAPGIGAVPQLGEARWGVDVRSSASVALTHTGDPWRMIQTIELAEHGPRLGDIDLQLPAGWRLETINADKPMWLRQLSGGGEVSELPPGSVITVVSQAVGVRAMTLTLSLSRVDQANEQLLPVQVRGSRRSSHRLSLLSAQAIDAQITAVAPWRMDALGGPSLPTGVLRAELFATGELAPVRVVTRRLDPEVGVEAVLYLAPGLRDDHWARLDLRLHVRSGEVDVLRLDVPLLRDGRLQIISPTLRLDEEATTLRLRAGFPLIGEHLLRLEGALDPTKFGQLVRLGLRIGDPAVEVPVRQVVVIQAPPSADLVLQAGAGVMSLAVDALPAWSRPLPGIPVSAAWRLTNGETGGYRLDRRALAVGPAGFIDQLTARTQVDYSSTMTLLTARVAAPTLQALPLIVPAGMSLLEATVDGHVVAVRRVGTGSELPLPGRTQVQVALLFSGQAPESVWSLSLPRLGTLPATTMTWTIAVAGGWRATVIEDPAAMVLEEKETSSYRSWFGRWWEAPVMSEIPQLPVQIQTNQQADQRALSQAEVVPPALGEPQLILRGHLFSGTRLGGEAQVRLQLTPIANLRTWDHVGWVMAVLAAVLLTWRCVWKLRLTLSLSAMLLAFALHGWGMTVGPLMALSEWLAPLTLAAGMVWWLVRRRPVMSFTTPTKSSVAVLFMMMAMTLSAGEAPKPVLMGYQRLDPAGVPQDIRVALTKADLTAMWQRAQADASVPAVCDLATGTPRFSMRFADGHLLGTMSLAVAVPGKVWRQVTLPFLPGSVRGVSARPLAGVDPGTVAWTSDQAGNLVLTLAPLQQADVIVDLDIPLTSAAGTWNVLMPLSAISGGSMTINAVAGWVPWIAERSMTRDGEGPWRSDLPVGQPTLALSLRQPLAAIAQEVHLGVDQRVRVTLRRDRLEWSAVLSCVMQGAGVRRMTMTIPEGLALTAIAGDGVADWNQRGTQVEVIATSPRTDAWTMRLGGVIAMTGTSDMQRAVLVRVDGAERSSGRLDLTAGDGFRFERPAGAAIERVDPLSGADQAVRWNADPGAVLVKWRALDNDLTSTLRAALVVGTDRVRIHATIDFAGPGQRDVVRLRLLPPWQLIAAPEGTEVVWREVNGQREGALRSAKPWSAGASIVLHLEAERRVLGQNIQTPDLRPFGEGISAEKQIWTFAGAGDRRLRLDDHEQQQAMNLDAARTIVGSVTTLNDDERWLQACSWRGDRGPSLTVTAEDAVVRVRASHYIVLAQDRVRWWAHLVHQVDQGELTIMRCTLPSAAKLTRVKVDGLGTWSQEGRELTVRLAAPTRRSTALDLEVEIALSKDSVTIDGMLAAGGTGPQDVALVEEDTLGLMQLDPQGLEAVTDPKALFSCPVGVDQSAIRYRWRSLRPQWSLAIKREALVTTNDRDRIVTLVDAVSVLGIDGECRGRATWQVLNRTQTQLNVHLPAGLELWEVRVAGRDVRPRQGATANDVVLPVTPQRPGEAAQAITMTWRERLDPQRIISPGMPRFTDLKIMQGLWRVVPPPGYELTRRGGTMLAIDAVEVEASRAMSAIDELKRLRGLSDLDDVGLQRLNNQLATIDLALCDSLVSLKNGTDKVQSQQRQSYNYQVITDVNSNRADLQQEIKRIDTVRSSRNTRRGQLGLDNPSQSWAEVNLLKESPGKGSQTKETVASPINTTYAPRANNPVTPRQAKPLLADANLGAGQAPPGHRKDDQSAVLGIDLLGNVGTEGLALRAQGNDLRMELTMSRTGSNTQPWLAALASLMVLAGGLWISRRR